jgi:formylglycine-generating enzyme required for sulfatase activity/dienelactone hydrolase
MNQERFRQIEQLFNAALAHDGPTRAAFLQEACGGDEVLQREIESLIDSGAVDPSSLDLSRFESRDLTPSLDSFDRFVGQLARGRYRITERIGKGGMGVVYRAVDEQLRRPVAIKFLPPDLCRNADRLNRFRNEARVLSALNHPHIVTVHEIGEADGIPFLAMELVDGTTLRERLRLGPIPLRETLEIVHQVAVALAAAHEKGIVHRDLKPENVMVRRDGYVKVVDFGLAALRAPVSSTESLLTAGSFESVAVLVGGTPAYMSPEQLHGAPADPHNDIFALGILLCELATGTNPFKRDDMIDTLNAVGQTPAPAVRVAAALSPALARIIVSALQKEPSRRHASASQFASELRRVVTQIDAAAVRVPSRHGRAYVVAAMILMLAAATAAAVAYRRAERIRWVRVQAMPDIARLTADDRFVPAFRLLQESERYLPGDPSLAALARESTRVVTINSSQPGAVVAVRDYLATDDSWLPLGATPLDHIRIPGGYLTWRVTTATTTYTVAPPTSEAMNFDLDQAAKAPEGMVPVRRQRFVDYLAYFGWVGPYELPMFFIDRVEVTNRQYQKFVDDGGYRRHEYWKYPFVTDGRALTWDRAMERFRDRTGRSAPSTWEAGHYPEGKADYPVSGVSWFEAAAYAEFAGKSLPVIAQSYVTAPPSLDRYISRLSDSSGTLVPVGQSRALGPYGTYDQLGNVREWYWNATPDNLRYVLGRFPSSYGPTALTPFDRSPVNGIRCVLNSKPLAADVVSARPLLRRDFATAMPASENVFRIYRNIYAYDHTTLHANVDALPGQAPDWTAEKITVDAAYGNERLPMYLFLPKHAQRPLQAVVFFPSARVLSIPNSGTLGDLSFVDYVIQSGRAVIYPIYQGMYERRSKVPSAGGPVVLRDTTVAWSRDFGRAIDYLETRPDIDASRIGFLGVSMGSAYGVILASLEKRVKAVVLLDGGFFQIEQPLSGTDQVDFAPRLTQPVLMVNGRYDATYALDSSQLPLFRMLGSSPSDKRHVLLETAHDVRARRTDMVREVLAWLDKYLGRIE